MAAVFVVALYLVSVCGAVFMQTGEESDAAAGTKGFYTYKITLTGDGANTVKVITNESGVEAAETKGISVDSPESGWSWNSDLASNDDFKNWKFNSVTGIGPFNSFYAAFDPTSNNKFLGKLNPYNLAQYLDGTAVGGSPNIMWILPTVYWKVDSDGSLILTNDPAAGGVAYAHTIGTQSADGKSVTYETYQYLAIGVYEATGSESGLYSKTGSTPTWKNTKDKIMDLATVKQAMNGQISTQGNQVNGQSMLWNFYQYSLYKYCVTALIGGFQFGGVGAGPKTGDVTTGTLDSAGPYGKDGTTGSMKLFLENVWGGRADGIGDAYIDGRGNLLIITDPNVMPTGEAAKLALKNTAAVQDTGVVFPAEGNSPVGQGWASKDGNITKISTSPYAWGLPTKTESVKANKEEKKVGNSQGFAYSSPAYDNGFTYKVEGSTEGTYKESSTATDEYYGYISRMAVFTPGTRTDDGSHDAVNQVSGYYWYTYCGTNAEQVGRLAFLYSENVELVSQTETVGQSTQTWKIEENATGGTCMYLPEPRAGVQGYTFSGWYSKDTFGSDYKVGEPGDPWILSTDNAKLYGKWEKALPTLKEFAVTVEKVDGGGDKVTVHLEPPDGWGGLEAGTVTIGGTYYRDLDGEAVRSYGQILGIDGKELEVQSLAWNSSQDLEFTLPSGWHAYLVYAEYEIGDSDSTDKQTARSAYILAGDTAVQKTS